MELFVGTVHVIVALFMILVVLVQGGNQGGIGAAFGGGTLRVFLELPAQHRFLASLPTAPP